MSILRSLLGTTEVANPTEFSASPRAEDAAGEASLALAPLEIVRTQRDIESTIGQLEELIGAFHNEGDTQLAGRRLLDSSRQLSRQLQSGFDALKAAQAVSQASITEKSVIVELIRDRLATRRHYGNPVSLVLFRVEDQQDSGEALAIVSRLIRVTDRAYLMNDREIVVVLPETSLEGGRVFASRCVLDTIDSLGTRAFAGVAAAVDNDDFNSLLERADEALYQARQDEYNFAYAHDGETVAACGTSVE